jgi:hypothetical protein
MIGRAAGGAAGAGAFEDRDDWKRAGPAARHSGGRGSGEAQVDRPADFQWNAGAGQLSRKRLSQIKEAVQDPASPNQAWCVASSRHWHVPASHRLHSDSLLRRAGTQRSLELYTRCTSLPGRDPEPTRERALAKPPPSADLLQSLSGSPLRFPKGSVRASPAAALRAPQPQVPCPPESPATRHIPSLEATQPAEPIRPSPLHPAEASGVGRN